MPVRVLVADDQRLVREGICAILVRDRLIQVVGEADSGRIAVRLARERSPHVVVMDVCMPDMNGIEATRHIVTELPAIRVLALSGHAEQSFVTETLRAGATGYLLKGSASEELLRAVHEVFAGRMYLSPSVAGVVVSASFGEPQGMNTSVSLLLTARQREVLQLVAEGLTTKQIAQRLYLAIKTIETHRHDIMRKLQCYSVAELTKYAVRNGVTALEY